MHNIICLLNTMSTTLKLSQNYMDFVFGVRSLKTSPSKQINAIIQNLLNYLNLDLNRHQ